MDGIKLKDMEKKMNKLLLALVALLPTPALAEPIAYPGSAWVSVTGPHNGVGEDGNWIASGKVQWIS